MALAWNICVPLGSVYIVSNEVFQLSTAKNEINLFNNYVLIVAPVTFAPAGATTPSAEFLFIKCGCSIYWFPHIRNSDISGYGYLEVFQRVPWNSR